MESDYTPKPNLELLKSIAYERRLQRILDNEKYMLIRNLSEVSASDQLAHDLGRLEIELKASREQTQLLSDVVFYKKHILRERNDR